MAISNDSLLSNLIENKKEDIFEKEIEKYLSDKNINSDKWLSFMSILSTLLAVFFVYT
jgi:hypothetical protein